MWKRANLRIFSCLACVYRVIDARRKFGEHDKDLREEAFHCDKVQNSHNAQKKEPNVPIGWSKTRHILYFCLSEYIYQVNR